MLPGKVGFDALVINIMYNDNEFRGITIYITKVVHFLILDQKTT